MGGHSEETHHWLHQNMVSICEYGEYEYEEMYNANISRRLKSQTVSSQARYGFGDLSGIVSECFFGYDFYLQSLQRPGFSNELWKFELACQIWQPVGL